MSSKTQNFGNELLDFRRSSDAFKSNATNDDVNKNDTRRDHSGKKPENEDNKIGPDNSTISEASTVKGDLKPTTVAVEESAIANSTAATESTTAKP